MDLIVLHGPPGVGKLTVARELAQRTRYRVFHNHLTFDLALSLFDRGTEPFQDLVDDLRVDLLERAARATIPGVIFTFVYGQGVDDAFIQRLVDAVEPFGTTVEFVLLTCDEEILLERVVEPSRRLHGKLIDAATLRSLLLEYRMMSPVTGRSGLTVDTSTMPPADTADIIASWMRDRRTAT